MQSTGSLKLSLAWLAEQRSVLLLDIECSVKGGGRWARCTATCRRMIGAQLVGA